LWRTQRSLFCRCKLVHDNALHFYCDHVSAPPLDIGRFASASTDFACSRGSVQTNVTCNFLRFSPDGIAAPVRSAPAALLALTRSRCLPPDKSVVALPAHGPIATLIADEPCCDVTNHLLVLLDGSCQLIYLRTRRQRKS